MLITDIEELDGLQCLFSSFHQFRYISDGQYFILQPLMSTARWLSGLRCSRVHSLWLLVDHCVLRNWDRILVRAVKGLISRAGMVAICPLLWQRDVKLQQTNQPTLVSCRQVIPRRGELDESLRALFITIRTWFEYIYERVKWS